MDEVHERRREGARHGVADVVTSERGPGRRKRLFRLPLGRGIRAEVDEELRFHIEERTAKYERAGLSHDEAVAEAERNFGDVRAIGDEVEMMMKRREKAMKQSDLIDDARRDATFAARQLLRNPGFSAVAILTIALASVRPPPSSASWTGSCSDPFPSTIPTSW